MNKFKSFCCWFCLAFLFTAPANAMKDKEAVQRTLKKADLYVKGGLNVYEEAQTTKREITNKINGAKGMVNTAKSMANAVKNGDLDGALAAADELNAAAGEMGIETGISKISGTKSLKNKVPAFISDVNDVKNSREEVSRNYNPQYGGGKDIEITEAQNEKIESIQRDNIASLYARALTDRVALAKEKAEDPEEIDTTDTRQIVTAIRKQALITASRLKKILDYETAVYEFRLTDAGKSFQSVGSSGAQSSDGGGS